MATYRSPKSRETFTRAIGDACQLRIDLLEPTGGSLSIRPADTSTKEDDQSVHGAADRMAECKERQPCSRNGPWRSYATAKGRRIVLADRARKARRSSRCPLCRGPIRIGQYIARLGLTWVHTICAAARM
jgi:hypothetical protein